MIKFGEVVGYENKGDFRGVVLEDVLKMFAEKARVELAPQAYPEESSQKILTKGIKLPSKLKINKIAISSTTDLEADKIIHALIKNGRLSSAVDRKIIKPLYLFLDKEVLLYAKLRNLVPKSVSQGGTSSSSSPPVKGDINTKGKFKKEKIKKDEISKFIDELEKTHPEVKQAVVGGYLGS